jgi:predicted metal-dependent phosphoesterase TrpH
MPSPPSFDLQSHSTHSDGALPPDQVVELAARAGIELLALTDHDSVGGVDEAVVAGANAGIAIVPAVEISSLGPGGRELHLLGYLIDVDNPPLRERLAGARASRERRAEQMIERLAELGLEVDSATIASRGDDTIGRPHIAAAVLAHPANASRLDAEGLGDLSAVLVAYLIPGKPAFVERMLPSIDDAIGWVHDAGGVAVWAHPCFDLEDPAAATRVLDELAAAGLDGAEVFYVTHSREQTELLDARSDALGLLKTGSADFHGPDHPRFNRFGAFERYGLEPRLGPIASP